MHGMEKAVGGKKRKYSEEFRREALERMKGASNVTALARELGIRRKWLYQWRDEEAFQAAGMEKPKAVRKQERESARLRKQVQELLQLVGKQEAKLHFFDNALRRVRERRQSSTGNGGTASSTPSGR